MLSPPNRKPLQLAPATCIASSSQDKHSTRHNSFVHAEHKFLVFLHFKPPACLAPVLSYQMHRLYRTSATALLRAGIKLQLEELPDLS